MTGRKYNVYSLLIFIYTLFLFKLTGGLTDSYSTTSYAFSYLEYGLASRMLLSTVYDLFCRIIPDLRTAAGCLYFMIAINIVMYFTFWRFGRYIRSKITDEVRNRAFSILYLLGMMIVCVSFSSLSNFGKTDSFLFICTIIQTYLLIEEKHEWLIIPLNILQVCTHEGFLCMTACVNNAILAYNIARSQNKRKYILLLAGSLVSICAPAVYFVFFKDHGTYEQFVSAFKYASSLNYRGSVHSNYIAQRLGMDVPEGYAVIKDAEYKEKEMIELPVFLCTWFLPYILICLKFIKNIFRLEKRKGTYIGMGLIVILLIMVEFIIFCDFGRYFVWYVYSFVMLMSFLAVKDKAAGNALASTVDRRDIIYYLLALFTLLSLPYGSSFISIPTSLIAGKIQELFKAKTTLPLPEFDITRKGGLM